MNKERERRAKFRRSRSCAAVLLLVLSISGALTALLSGCGGKESVPAVDIVPETEPLTAEATTQPEEQEEEQAAFFVYPERTDSSVKLGKEIDAKNAVLFNAETGQTVAYKDENVQIWPASLTKVMTLIVVVENVEDLSAKVTFTEDMIAPFIDADASRSGYEPGETATIEELLYGIILASGADSAKAAAVYTAGSEEAFVELMNKKAEEMGLRRTHFTNTTGLHDKQHYSTAADMGAILSYAMSIELCRKILMTEEYILPAEQHPDGIKIESTLFSRMYGDEMPGVLVEGGKTGYTDQSLHCVEAFADVNGTDYILVLCGSTTKWNAVYGTLSAFSVYCAGGKAYEPPANK
ncbi:MAG TPA: serine hydrolase [Ruminococcus sp.]|nr:serine hydrolase [Ruminococcus sp.]